MIHEIQMQRQQMQPQLLQQQLLPLGMNFQAVLTLNMCPLFFFIFEGFFDQLLSAWL